MVSRRTGSRTASRFHDDRAVAGVVGFVLILAAAITYYSYAAQAEVPRRGAENERAWDSATGASLTRLAQAAGAGAGGQSAVREALAAAPEAPTQTVPFLSPLHSARATGALELVGSCGGATLTHHVGTETIVDLADGTTGCLTFRGQTAYADAFAYRLELGGVLRLQGGNAAVLAGPPLEVAPGRVSLTLIDLQGASQAIGTDRALAPIALTPLPGALEVGSSANADGFEWRFTTSYPEAWRDWYQGRFVAAGVDVTSAISCPNPAESGPARGPCEVTIASTTPTSLSISYGRYAVDLG